MTMKIKQQSIFNLIEIFRSAKRITKNNLVIQSHCEQKHHHDFYCDAEKPYVTNNSF